MITQERDEWEPGREVRGRDTHEASDPEGEQGRVVFVKKGKERRAGNFQKEQSTSCLVWMIYVRKGRHLIMPPWKYF